MQSNELKKNIIKLLKEDEEFRYTVAGLIGYDAILKSLDEHDKKFNEILQEIAKLRQDMKNESAKVWDEIARLREDMKNEFSKVWQEIKDIKLKLDEHTRILISMDKRLGNIEKEVGELGNKYGFTLEDIVVTKLPLLLQKEGIIINREDIKARYLIPINGRKIEVDIYVEGRINGRMVKIIGEVKGRIDKSDVNRFYNKFKGYDAYKFIFGHTIRPDAEVKAKELGIRLFATYSY